MPYIVAGQKRVELTPEDLLWAGRAAACEAGGNKAGVAAVLWAWASRLGVGSRDSYGDLIRAHSQPVNEAWRATGDACRPGGSWGARAPGNWYGLEPCSPERLARRERCRSLTWDELAPVVKDAVLAFAAGKLPNPVPRVVDFADTTVTAKAGLVLAKQIGGNLFYTNAASRAWPAKHVRVVGDDGSMASDAAAGAAGALGAALGLAAAYAAYRAWRSR